MTEFKFNFSHDKNSNDNSSLTEPKNTKISWLASTRHELTKDRIVEIDKAIERATIYMCGEYELKHLSKPLNNKEIEVSFISKAEKDHSDLLPGIYEGGLKIWECTKDLIEYILEGFNKEKWKESKVLDLGCGAGLLGIFSMYLGAQHVTFQDYNEEVIQMLTMPNIILNQYEEDEHPDWLKKCSFYSGDWASFNNKLGADEKFDIILTSETIYNIENYTKLIQLFKDRLNKGGVIFLAAKTCYFGVGGGTRLFEEAIVKDSTLKCEVVWKSDSGIQREILKITFC